jgi:hypothetical protein
VSETLYGSINVFGSFGEPRHLFIFFFFVSDGLYAPLLQFGRSVETFERKLEEAQKNLNIAPRDYIPVMYVKESHFMSEALR